MFVCLFRLLRKGEVRSGGMESDFALASQVPAAATWGRNWLLTFIPGSCFGKLGLTLTSHIVFQVPAAANWGVFGRCLFHHASSATREVPRGTDPLVQTFLRCINESVDDVVWLHEV